MVLFLSSLFRWFIGNEQSIVDSVAHSRDNLNMNPPEGFVVHPLPLENVPIAYNPDGTTAYYCQLESEWIYGTLLIHRDDNVTTYTCSHCNQVLETIKQ